MDMSFSQLPEELQQEVQKSILAANLVNPRSQTSPYQNTKKHPTLSAAALARIPFHGQTVTPTNTVEHCVDFSGDSSSSGAGTKVFTSFVQQRFQYQNAVDPLLTYASVGRDQGGFETAKLGRVAFGPDMYIGVRYRRDLLLSSNRTLARCAQVCSQWREVFGPVLLRFVVVVGADERAADLVDSPTLADCEILDRLATDRIFDFGLVFGRHVPNGPEQELFFESFPIDLIKQAADGVRIVAKPSMVAHSVDGQVKMQAECRLAKRDATATRPPLDALPNASYGRVVWRRSSERGILFSAAYSDDFHSMPHEERRRPVQMLRTHCMGGLVHQKHLPIGLAIPPKTTSTALAKLCGFTKLAPLRLKLDIEFAHSGGRATAYSRPFYVTTRSLFKEEVERASAKRKRKP